MDITKDKEHVELEAQIREHFPKSKQLEAIENLSFIVTVAYLRGQRDVLLEQEAKRNTAFSRVES